jgi:hypothetical protein
MTDSMLHDLPNFGKRFMGGLSESPTFGKNGHETIEDTQPLFTYKIVVSFTKFW